ncbi:hypothetical protein FRC00_010213 [Tulasnella sp. 408]|nr:hypothetical protein FRC00_010213 [Tulasnella sp. 408]
MFRLIRSKTKKEPKAPKPKEEVKRKPVKEPSPARHHPVEGPSELQIAKADALRKTHVPKEKGLPSFAEFGTKDMLLYESDDDEDEPAKEPEPEPTLKGGLMVPGQEDRRGRGRHSAGSGSAYSRTPSPQLMPPSRDPSPMGRAPSPHISPLRERPHSYDQYHYSPQHATGQNLGSYYQDTPAADSAWRSSSYAMLISVHNPTTHIMGIRQAQLIILHLNLLPYLTKLGLGVLKPMKTLGHVNTLRPTHGRTRRQDIRHRITSLSRRDKLPLLNRMPIITDPTPSILEHPTITLLRFLQLLITSRPQWDPQALDQEIRRRTYSLQPDARPRQEEYDVRAQRTGRHSDYSQPDPRYQQAAQPAYGQQQQQQQQYPQQNSQQVSRAHTRRRVESMTSHLERTHISSTAQPTSRQDIARLSIYHTPSDSRSRESFDFSSASEADVSPSPSPAPRRHHQRTSSVVDGRPQSVYPPTDSRTSLQSLPEESYAYNGSDGLRGAGGYAQGYEREGSKQRPDPVRTTPREVTTFEDPSPGPTLQDIRRKATRRYTEAPRETEDRHRSRSRHSEVPATNQYQQDYSDRRREPSQPAEPYSREPSAAGYDADYSQVPTNVDRHRSKTPAPHQYIHESDQTSASNPSRDSLMYESQTGSHIVYDEPEESVPAPPPPSRTPAPTTPHRRRTVVLNGPRGPRSPPTQTVMSSNSPAARVSLARA